jgi:peptide/nickel transport system substrate-binding protein
MHDEYEENQFWALVPNPNYWNGAPKLDRLINRYFEDETSAVLALEGGEIHFTYASGDVALRLEDNPDFVLHAGPSGVTNYLIFNIRNPAFEDVRVRQAFLYAIDRQTIAETVLQNTVEVLPCTASLAAMRPEEGLNDYAYDPDMARQLLAEAGWDYSVSFDIDTYYTSQFALDALAAMQAYLGEVGIEAVPKTVDVPTYNSYFYDGEGWDISYRGIGSTLNYPWSFYIEGGFVEGESLMGPIFPELEDLIAQAQSETDPDRYLELLGDICLFQNQNALEGYMWTSIRFGVGSAKLQDFYWAPISGGGPYEDHPELWSVSE